MPAIVRPNELTFNHIFPEQSTGRHVREALLDALGHPQTVVDFLGVASPEDVLKLHSIGPSRLMVVERRLERVNMPLWSNFTPVSARFDARYPGGGATVPAMLYRFFVKANSVIDDAIECLGQAYGELSLADLLDFDTQQFIDEASFALAIYDGGKWSEGDIVTAIEAFNAQIGTDVIFAWARHSVAV